MRRLERYGILLPLILLTIMILIEWDQSIVVFAKPLSDTSFGTILLNAWILAYYIKDMNRRGR